MEWIVQYTGNDRFPKSVTERRKLPVGDYALILQDRPAAVVERKTFDNMLTDVSKLQVLHHR